MKSVIFIVTTSTTFFVGPFETLCMDYIYKLLGVERDNYSAYNTTQTNIQIRWFDVFFASFVKRA